MDCPVRFHSDALMPLTRDIPLQEKLDHVRAVVNHDYPFITRIAAALYDEESDLLKTFIHSSDQTPLTWYETRLKNCASLLEIVQQRQPRVVNDLTIFAESGKEHSRAVLDGGFEASYTMPMFHKDQLFGFLFFNSSRKSVFDEELLRYLDLVAHLLSQTIVQQMIELRTLLGAVSTIQEITNHRDNETGEHLQRMARYARLIALAIAPKYDLSDETVEHIHLFAPLHDVGKIAIPDGILLKEDRLTAAEFDIMKTHTSRGREIIDAMLEHFDLTTFRYAGLLRNIVQYHHEKLDGSGYHAGLEGGQIPLEARIIAVADIFDALTSRRPYKGRWSNEAAFEFLLASTERELDRECVEALIANRERVEEIQRLHPDD